MEFTRKDYNFIVGEISKALEKSFLGEFGFFVYGSYWSNKWRVGLSDIDAIIYFFERVSCFSEKFIRFRRSVSEIHKNFDLLDFPTFFGDIFIQDCFIGRDGRFFIFDLEKTDSFRKQENKGLISGKSFLQGVNPVVLRHEQESELAHGLHQLRNFWFFDLTRGLKDENFNRAMSLVKFFRILPKRVSVIAGDEMKSDPGGLLKYNFLSLVDLDPLFELFQETTDLQSMKAFVKRWFDEDDDVFPRCLNCFESILFSLIENTKMLSRRSSEVS